MQRKGRANFLWHHQNEKKNERWRTEKVYVSWMHSRLFTLSVLPFSHTKQTRRRYSIQFISTQLVLVVPRTIPLHEEQCAKTCFNAFYDSYRDRENKLSSEMISFYEEEKYTRHTGTLKISVAKQKTDKRMGENIKNVFIDGRTMRKKTRSEYEQTSVEMKRSGSGSKELFAEKLLRCG